MSFFSKFPVLETKRLLLRELQYEDGPDICAYFNEDVAKYYDWLPSTIAEGRGFVRYFKTGYEEELSIRWGITLKSSSKIIGTCGFSDFYHFSRAEIGYELSKDYWNQGIMMEALQTIIAFGFSKIGIHRMQASVFPENHASIHLLEKLGFEREGVLKEYTYVRHRNVWEDCLVLALLRSSFHLRDYPTGGQGNH